MQRTPLAEKKGRSEPSRIDAQPPANHPGSSGGGAGHAGGTRGHPGGHPMSAPKTIDAFFVPAGRDPLTEAFSGREFSPPWRGSVAIDPAEAGNAVAQAFATPRAEPAAIYINVPYCQSRCLFCGFFQNIWRPELSDAFVNDVVAEMEEMAATPLVSTAPIESVYLGGGTPSALLSAPLARLIANVRRLLPLAPGCEITVEGRAYGFGLEKAVAAFDAGANRVSLGVQTFDTAVRRRLGRKLDGAETLAFLNDLAALDRASIVCDLMYGLPGQSRDIWRRDIETVASSRIDGVTLYALNIFRGGPLAKSISDDKLPPAAPVGEQAQMYAEAAEFLVAEGFRQVSQSHFARGERERNRYNSGIKRGVPCIPFGPGAGGQAHGVRWSNLVSIEERKAAKAEGHAPIAGASRMPAAYAAQAAITAGLEAGALAIASVDAIAPGFQRTAAPLLDNWAAAGLGTVENGVFRATRAGAFWITNLTGGLYAALDAIQHKDHGNGGNRMTETQTAFASKEEALAALAARLETNPDGVIEALAESHGVSVVEAMQLLPRVNCTFAPASAFDDIMNDLAEWGDVTVVVHTKNLVLECRGPLPKGEYGRGFFNLHGKSPIGGHIKASRCASIAFVRRPFMGKESCSVQFFDTEGEAMFKVFVGRLADYSLNPEQVAKFEALKARGTKALADA